MGGFLSGILGTNSSVGTSSQNPYQAIAPYQGQASTLANQLQTQALGGGPNPAQMQYLQNAQQIGQTQATNYANNRSLNPGLAARMAGNTAAQTQNSAAAQAATQQAQQQLASQNLLGNVLQGQMGAANQASSINAGIAAGNQQQAGNIVGGILSGAGAALGLAHGGKVENFAAGGIPQQAALMSSPDFLMATSPTLSAPQFGSSLQQSAPSLGVNTQLPTATSGQLLNGSQSGPKSQVGKTLSGVGSSLQNSNPMGALQSFEGLGRFAKGGKVPAMVSPGELFVKPEDAKQVAKGKVDPLKVGEKIPGKAKVSGDSEKNDTVRRNLPEGGVVVPRSIMNSDDPEKEAMKFIANALAKHRKTPEGEFHEALKRAIATRKNK